MKVQPLEFEKPIAELQGQLEELLRSGSTQDLDVSRKANAITAKIARLREEIYKNLTPWQRVQIARHPNGRSCSITSSAAFTDFCRTPWRPPHRRRQLPCPADSPPLAAVRCVVVGHQKGRDTKENLKRNFGSAHPEGYRKALRLMSLAEKFGLPVITFIDTPGAFPGIGAEERNIAEAIAFNLREMMRLKSPSSPCPRRGRLRRRARHRCRRPRPHAGKRLLLGHQPGRAAPPSSGSTASTPRKPPKP